MQKSDLFLVFLILTGSMLRLYGIHFGLPYLYHQDEPVTVGVALKFGAGDPNPHYFAHPHLLHYVLFLLYGTAFLIGFLFRIFHSVADFKNLFFRDPTLFYLLGRIFCALIGTGTLFVIYGYAKRLYGHRVGILSCLFLATSFLHIRNSHYVRHDVPVVFMMLASSWAISRLLERGKRIDYFYTGLLLGLTVVTNWNGAILFVPFLIAAFLGRGTLIHLAIAGGAGFLGAFLGSPYLFLDFRGSLHEVFSQLSQMGVPGAVSASQNVPSLTGWSRYLFYYLRVGMGWPLELFGILGLFFLLRRPRREDLVFLSIPLFYFCVIGSVHRRVRAEYILPLLPYLYMSGAVFLVRSTELFRRIRKELFLAVSASLLIFFPTVQSIRHDYLLTQKDTRTLAKEWIEAHIPSGRRIAMDRYLHLRSWVPPILETDEQNEKLLRVIQRESPLRGKMREGRSSIKLTSPRYVLVEISSKDHLLEEYESGYDFDELARKEVDYIVTSNFISDFQEGAFNPRIQQFYEGLRERGQLLKRFSPFKKKIVDEYQDHASHTPLDRLNALERPGPVIEIYAFTERHEDHS